MNSKRQSELAEEILLFKEQNNLLTLAELRGLDNEDTPSFFHLLSAFDNLSLSEKGNFTSFASENCFALEVVNYAIEQKVLTPNSSTHNIYKNGLSTFSYMLGKYYGINHLADLTPAIWDNVTRALADHTKTVRDGVSTRSVNAARNFKKTFNSITKDSPLTLVIYSSTCENRGRAPTETKLKHICGNNKNYVAWQLLWDEWKNNIILKNSKSLSAMIVHLIKFLTSKNIDMNPVEFLLLPKKPCFWTYIKENSNNPRPIATRLHEFTNWIINDKLNDFDDGKFTSLAAPLLNHDVYGYVLDYKKPNIKGKADNVKAILPIKYLNLLRRILIEDNFAWPKSLEWTWKKLTNAKTKAIENIWHPHLAIIYLMLLEIPLRKIQVVSLDSGEGDDFRWREGKWELNNAPASGYWSKNIGDAQGRGVIRKSYAEGNETTAIYINTNKTQDIDKGFGATSGYIIDWHNDSFINLVELMREWQEQYNPIIKPTPYRDIPNNTFPDSPTEAVINLIPDRFYLFRYPLNVAKNGYLAPPADYILFKFWHFLMNELEHRLKESGEDVTITLGWQGNLPNKSIFTPHCLRGSGLTALSEAGVSLEILSQIIAGHSSILMTLGYIKYNNSYITNILNEARLKIEQNEQDNFTRYLKNSTWDDAYKYAIFNEAMDVAEWESTKSISLFENRQIGVCQNSGTRCSEGGELLRKDGAKSIYAPVPGGNGNCVRCRFFMTGLPFLIPLWLKCNKDLSEAQQISSALDSESRILDKLRKKRYDIVKNQGASHIPQSMQTEIKQSESRLDSKSALLDQTLLNVHASYNIIKRVKNDLKQDKSKFPKVIDEQPNEDGENEFETISLFKQRDFLVRASRLYPHITDRNLELERNHFIDKIMFNMGMTPITLSTLTDAEKEAACDAAAAFLISKLNDHELTMIESGAIDINTLGIGINDVTTLKSTLEDELKKISMKDEK